MITVIAWIALIYNILGAILNFINTFKKEIVIDRVLSFIATIIQSLTAYLAYYVLIMI
ncbi:hypothetical protein ACTFH7_02015 [Clostridium cagae]|uniref:hypothetical protein n=1 Tax=Clostridium TaxID=1485 RepID=UPI0002E13332|nr:hypothetical protein [Clostridium sp. VAP51]